MDTKVQFMLAVVAMMTVGGLVTIAVVHPDQAPTVTTGLLALLVGALGAGSPVAIHAINVRAALRGVAPTFGPVPQAQSNGQTAEQPATPAGV